MTTQTLALDEMMLVYQRPDSLTDVATHYCPGCTHGIIHRLVAEVLDELRRRGVRVDPGKRIVLYAPTWRGTLSNVRGGADDQIQLTLQSMAASAF